METIGKILKNARERKGVSIEDLASSTKIVSRYIVALENESFEELPGEIYVKGFLKNISDKLAINATEIIEIYNLQKAGRLHVPLDSLVHDQSKPIRVKKKNLKIEEEVIEESKDDDDENSDIKIFPDTDDEKTTKIKKDDSQKIKSDKMREKNVKEAIKETRKSSVDGTLYSAEQALLMMSRQDLPKLKVRSKGGMHYLLISLFFVIIVLGVLAYIFRDSIDITIPTFIKPISKFEDDEALVQRNIVDTVAKQNVKVGDIVYFKPLGISATINIISIGNILKANINGEEVSLSKSSPVVSDLNGNGIDDFRMSLVEVYDDLATVSLERLVENEALSEETTYNDDQALLEGIPNINTTEVVDGVIYLLRDVEKTYIKINITAQGFVYVRYFIDSERPATTNLLSGRSLSLTGENVIMLTLGDAGEVVINVNGKPVTLGIPGETVNKTITWVKNINDSTKYSLTISDTK